MQFYRLLIKKILNKCEYVGIVSDNKIEAQGKQIHNYPIKNINMDVLVEIIISNKVNIVISIQFPKIFTVRILKLVNGNSFNLHNAKLPDFRVHNSLTYEILNNEKENFATIHKMDKEVDRGKMVAELKVEINKHETCLQSL